MPALMNSQGGGRVEPQDWTNFTTCGQRTPLLEGGDSDGLPRVEQPCNLNPETRSSPGSTAGSQTRRYQ